MCLSQVLSLEETHSKQTVADSITKKKDIIDG